MPKIISKRGKTEAQEIEVDLDEVIVHEDEDEPPGMTVTEYFWDETDAVEFISTLHKMGCWVTHTPHEQFWKIFYGKVQVAAVTDYAVQSDMATILDYVRDTIEVLNSISKTSDQP